MFNPIKLLFVSSASCLALLLSLPAFDHQWADSEADKYDIIAVGSCEGSYDTETTTRCLSTQQACQEETEEFLTVRLDIEFDAELGKWIPKLVSLDGSGSGGITFPITLPDGCDPEFPENVTTCGSRNHHTKDPEAEGSILSLKNEPCPTYTRNSCQDEALTFTLSPFPSGLEELLEGLIPNNFPLSVELQIPGVMRCVNGGEDLQQSCPYPNTKGEGVPNSTSYRDIKTECLPAP